MPVPAVSVIIPAHNAAPHLGQAIDSVLAQESVPVEAVVVDDGSTDDTRAVLESYGGRVRWTAQANAGPSAARNTGVALAEGEFVAFLDADDWFLPRKLADQVARLQSDRTLGAVHSGWTRVDETGNVIEAVTPWVYAPRLDLETWLLWKPVFLGAMLFRRDWITRVGPFDPALRWSEDVDLLLRLSSAGCRITWLRRSTVCYRDRPGSLTQDLRGLADSLMTVLDRFYARPHLPGRLRSLEGRVRYFSLMWIVSRLWSNGDVDGMTDYLRQSLRHGNSAVEWVVYDWFGRLAGMPIGRGMAARSIGVAYPAFQRAAGLDDSSWAPIQESLEWLDQVWFAYLAGNRQVAVQHLRESRPRPVRAWVKLAQAGLLSRAAGASVEPVDWFAEDLADLGWLPPRQRHEIATLYLTVFAQAIFHRRWREAARGMGRAFRVGATWRAVGVWSRFLSAATVYYLRPARRNRRILAGAATETS